MPHVALGLILSMWSWGFGATRDEFVGAIRTPLDVRGQARGVVSVPSDPAAPAAADGFALHYRHRFLSSDSYRVGGYGVFPWGPLVVQAGYEWHHVPRGLLTDREGLAPAAAQDLIGRAETLLGVSGRLGEHFSAGLTYRRLHGGPAGAQGNLWRIGVFSEPTSWLSWSGGVDALNQPRVGGERLRPTYVAGVGLRPWFGHPWLTLAAEVQSQTGSPRGLESPRLARASIELRPWSGLALTGAYQRIPDPQWWVGLSVSAQGFTLATAGLAHASEEATPNPSGSGFFDDAMVAATYRTRAEPGLTTRLTAGTRIVQVRWEGDLHAPTSGWLEEKPTVSTAALRLAALARDPSIGRVILSIGRLDVGLGVVDELRDAIRFAQQRGKQVFARIAGGDERVYMVAAVCDEIVMEPLATLRIDGFAAQAFFLAQGLNRWGIRVESVEVGRYKTGPDPLTRSQPRPEDEEVRREILAQARKSLWKRLKNDRGLSEEQIESVVREGMFSGARALELGLVDALSAPIDPTQPLPAVEFAEWSSDPPPTPRWGPAPRIVVVPVIGTIVMADSDNPLPGPSAVAAKVIAQLEAAARDADVKGVVIRVDSPGGSVLASELIWREVRRTARIKPLVVSMGDTAASGGYYVAAPADFVFAEPNTLTGSIGIFSLKLDLSGFFEWLGVHSHTLKTDPVADWDFLDHELRPADRQRLRSVLDEYYRAFVQRVSAGRRIALPKVLEIAEGRLYTGQKALQLGLVDGLGGLVQAVEEVRRRAGLRPDEPVRVDIPHEPSTLKKLLGSGGPAFLSPGVYELASELVTGPFSWVQLARRWAAWQNEVLALAPFSYVVE